MSKDIPDISSKDSKEVKMSKLKDLEPDWHRQYQMQDAFHMAEIARREAVINAQVELLADYWEKHQQNLKAYEQNTVSLDEFHKLEQRIIQNKRQRMNRSYVIGERAFRETYDSTVRDSFPEEDVKETSVPSNKSPVAA